MVRIKFWTHIRALKGVINAFKSTEAKALRIYHQIGSVTDTVRQLGTPAENTYIDGFVTREKQKKNERSLILKTPPNIPETLQRSLN